MNDNVQARLLKILALADSSHDGEAVAAVRMAKQLLAQQGKSFADLARGMVGVLPVLRDDSATLRVMEMRVTDLQRRLQEAQQQVQERGTALAAVNYRVQQLEQSATRAQTEVEKWRNLARDTANKLWDIGQQIAEDRATSHEVVDCLQNNTVRSPRPVNNSAAGLRERHFVRNSLLEAQESAAPAVRAMRAK